MGNSHLYRPTPRRSMIVMAKIQIQVHGIKNIGSDPWTPSALALKRQEAMKKTTASFSNFFIRNTSSTKQTQHVSCLIDMTFKRSSLFIIVKMSRGYHGGHPVWIFRAFLRSQEQRTVALPICFALDNSGIILCGQICRKASELHALI